MLSQVRWLGQVSCRTNNLLVLLFDLCTLGVVVLPVIVRLLSLVGGKSEEIPPNVELSILS